MNVDLARHVIGVNFGCSRELQSLMQLLKTQLPEAEYKTCAAGIAVALDAISEALTNKAVAAHPELSREIETSIELYDRYL